MALGRKTGGRKAGTPNKDNAQITKMVDQALDEAGGVEYLKRQAESNPAAFLSLVGKRMPRVVEGPGDNGEHTVTFTWRS